MLPIKANTLEIQRMIEDSHGLRSYLSNLYSKGREATPPSWFYEGKTPEELLKYVLSITKNQFDNPIIQQAVDQIEEKNLEKFGPQGKVPPFTSKEAKEVLDPVYEKSMFDRENALEKFFQYTPKFAEYLFGKNNLYSKRPKEFSSVVDDMTDRDTLSSNSGLPYFTRRSKVVSEEIALAKQHKYDVWLPAILLYRHYHGKLRPVWMYPMDSNLREYQFTQVIQDALRSSPNKSVRSHVTPWEGFEDVKIKITQTWNHPRGGDTSKMDAHMRLAQTKLVYEIVKHLFQRKYWDDLWKSMRQVNEIDLLVAPNKRIAGKHGLASGSGWTQLLETILILFVLWYNKIFTSMGIGDDFEFMQDLSAKEIVRMLAEFGLPANESKQSVSNDILDFLQRFFAKGFYSRESSHVLGAYYSMVRALNSWKLPEKFHNPEDWNSDMYNARFYMIAENLVDDPHFPELMIWAANGQKDTIAFAKKSDSELKAITKQAKLLPGLNPSYNQEKRRKPLSQFYSIKFVRENL